MTDWYVPFDPEKHDAVDNHDGTWSTERTITVKDGPMWAVIPSLWFTSKNTSTQMDEKASKRLANMYEKNTGRRFPRFVSRDAADAFARLRSEKGGANQGPLAK